jgi:hypothetical protein
MWKPNFDPTKGRTNTMKTAFLAACLSALFSFQAAGSERIVYLQESENQGQLAVFDRATQKIESIVLENLTVIYPDISRDGNFLAFSATADSKNYGIYLYDLRSKELKQVVAPNGMTIQPTFSGNGRWLAYTAPITTTKNQIYLLNLEQWKTDPNTKATLLPTDDSAYYPCLSSAGTQATFHLSQKAGDRTIQKIAVFDVKKNELIQFKNPGAPKSPLEGKSPCFSFDDEEITFISQIKGDWNVFKIKSDGTNLVQLTNSPAKDYSPRFMADGSVLFSSDRDGGLFRFYRLKEGVSEVTGEKPEMLHQEAINIWDPRVSGSVEIETAELFSIPGEARSSFATLKHQNRIYVIGGHQGFEHTYPENSFSPEVHAYDLKTGRWSKLANKSHPVHGLTAKAYGNYICILKPSQPKMEISRRNRALRHSKKHVESRRPPTTTSIFECNRSNWHKGIFTGRLGFDAKIRWRQRRNIS